MTATAFFNPDLVVLPGLETAAATAIPALPGETVDESFSEAMARVIGAEPEGSFASATIRPQNDSEDRLPGIAQPESAPSAGLPVPDQHEVPSLIVLSQQHLAEPGISEARESIETGPVNEKTLAEPLLVLRRLEQAEEQSSGGEGGTSPRISAGRLDEFDTEIHLEVEGNPETDEQVTGDNPEPKNPQVLPAQNELFVGAAAVLLGPQVSAKAESSFNSPGNEPAVVSAGFVSTGKRHVSCGRDAEPRSIEPVLELKPELEIQRSVPIDEFLQGPVEIRDVKGGLTVPELTRESSLPSLGAPFEKLPAQANRATEKLWSRESTQSSDPLAAKQSENQPSSPAVTPQSSMLVDGGADVVPSDDKISIAQFSDASPDTDGAIPLSVPFHQIFGRRGTPPEGKPLRPGARLTLFTEGPPLILGSGNSETNRVDEPQPVVSRAGQIVNPVPSGLFSMSGESPRVRTAHELNLLGTPKEASEAKTLKPSGEAAQSNSQAESSSVPHAGWKRGGDESPGHSEREMGPSRKLAAASSPPAGTANDLQTDVTVHPSRESSEDVETSELPPTISLVEKRKTENTGSSPVASADSLDGMRTGIRGNSEGTPRESRPVVPISGLSAEAGETLDQPVLQAGEKPVQLDEAKAPKPIVSSASVEQTFSAAPVGPIFREEVAGDVRTGEDSLILKEPVPRGVENPSPELTKFPFQALRPDLADEAGPTPQAAVRVEEDLPPKPVKLAPSHLFSAGESFDELQQAEPQTSIRERDSDIESQSTLNHLRVSKGSEGGARETKIERPDGDAVEVQVDPQSGSLPASAKFGVGSENHEPGEIIAPAERTISDKRQINSSAEQGAVSKPEPAPRSVHEHAPLNPARHFSGPHPAPAEPVKASSDLPSHDSEGVLQNQITPALEFDSAEIASPPRQAAKTEFSNSIKDISLAAGEPAGEMPPRDSEDAKAVLRAAASRPVEREEARLVNGWAARISPDVETNSGNGESLRNVTWGLSNRVPETAVPSDFMKLPLPPVPVALNAAELVESAGQELLPSVTARMALAIIPSGEIRRALESSVASNTDQLLSGQVLPEATLAARPASTFDAVATPARGPSFHAGTDASPPVRGTAGAEQRNGMKATKEQTDSAVPRPKKLPGQPVVLEPGAGLSEKSEPSFATVRGPGPFEAGRAVEWWPKPELKESVPQVRTEAGQIARPANLDRIMQAIEREAVVIRDSSANSLAVVLKPDAHTELFLQLSHKDGWVEAYVRCERGDSKTLHENWNFLQESLAQQNVRLLPIREGLQFSPSSSAPDTSNFRQPEQQRPPQPEFASSSDRQPSQDGSRRQPAEAAHALSSVPERSARSRRAKAKVAAVNGWESWA